MLNDDGLLLRHGSEMIRANKTIVLQAVSQNPDALRHADRALFDDADFLRRAVTIASISEEVVIKAVRLDAGLMRFVDEDSPVVHKAIEANLFAARFVSKASVLVEAARRNPRVLQFADMAKSYVYEVVRENGFALEFLPDQLRNDAEIVLAAVASTESASEAAGYESPLCHASDELVGDHAYIRRALVVNSRALSGVRDELILSFFQYVLNIDGLYLSYGGNTVRSNRALVLAAVMNRSAALKYASDELKDDPDVVLTAVRSAGFCLQMNPLCYASNRLLHDSDFLFSAYRANRSCFYGSFTTFNESFPDAEIIRCNGYMLKFASESLKNDKTVVISALNYPSALQFASDKLRDDKDVVFTAVSRFVGFFNNPLQFTSKRLLEDHEFLFSLFKCNKKAFDGSFTKFSVSFFRDVVLQDDALMLRYAPECLKNDKSVALNAIDQNVAALQYVSKELKDDLEVVFRAVVRSQNLNTSGDAAANPLGNASIRLLGDLHFLQSVWNVNKSLFDGSFSIYNDSFIRLKILEDGLLIRSSSMALRSDVRFVLDAVKQNSSALEYASDLLKGNWEVVLAAVLYFKTGKSPLSHASLQLLENSNFLYFAYKINNSCFDGNFLFCNNDFPDAEIVCSDWNMVRFASERLKEDKHVAMATINQNPRALEHVSKILKDDAEVVLCAVQNSKNIECRNFNPLLFASSRLMGDFDFLESAYELNKDIFDGDLKIENDYFIKQKVLEDGVLLKHGSEQVRKDKITVLNAVNQNNSALEYASEKLKDDEDVLLAAVENFRISTCGKSPLALASARLLGDFFFLKSAYNINKDVFHGQFIITNDTVFKNFICSLQPSCAYRHLEGCVLLMLASTKLQHDRDVVLCAVQQNFLNLKYASDRLKDDETIVLAAISGFRANTAQSSMHPSPLIHVSKRLMKNYDFLHQAVKTFHDNSELLGTTDIDNRLFLREAILKNGLLLAHASETLRSDAGIAHLAILQNPYAFQFVSKSLKQDLEFILGFLQNSRCLPAIEKSKLLNMTEFGFLNKRDQILSMLKAGLNILHEIGQIVPDNFDFFLKATLYDGSVLMHASKEIQANRTIVQQAVFQNPEALKYADRKLLDDLNFLREVLPLSHSSC